MLKIHKYPLDFESGLILTMPAGAKILSVQLQRETMCVWALVDINQKDVERQFIICGTGHSLGDNPPGEFIGTVQTMNGALVWHVFVVPEKQS